MGIRSLLIVVVLVVVALTWAAAAAAASTPPVVELFTTSTDVPVAELQAWLPALQTLVDDELGPVWGVQARLIVGDAAHPSPADMTVMVTDQIDCLFCGGYHDDVKGHPFAKVFPYPGEAASLILSHELEEMLVDPFGNRFASWHDRMWIVEVGDPVESGFYAHWIAGVAISDFITPAWYGVGRGPYDFGGFLSRPGQIGRHGYASFRTAPGVWGQVFG